MLRVCLLASAFSLASLTAIRADEVPADARKKVLDALRDEAARRPGLRARQAELKALLEHASAGVVDKSKKAVFVPEKIDKKNPIRFPSAKAREDYVKDLEKKINVTIDKLRGPDDKPESFAPEVRLNSVGSWGRFAPKVVTVDTVIDKRSALLRTRTETTDRPLDGQAITVLVEGIDTSKYADNLKVGSPPGVFYVVGNKKVQGQTHFHLVPLTLTDDELKELARFAKGSQK